jgi:virginiamycin B lyase
MPDPAAKDPHTLVFDRTGKDIWFTVQGGGFVGRLTMATGKVDLVKIPSEGSRPYGIWMDSKNRPWFNEFGVPKIGMIEPSTLALKEYDLPNERARGRRIAITSDDIVWYVDYSRGFLGRLDPATGKVEEWATPGGANSLPYMLTADNKDRLWFSETGMQPVRIVGFDPRSKTFVPPIAVPSGGLNVRYAIYNGASNAIWFGTDANTIARAQLP